MSFFWMSNHKKKTFVESLDWIGQSRAGPRAETSERRTRSVTHASRLTTLCFYVCVHDRECESVWMLMCVSSMALQLCCLKKKKKKKTIKWAWSSVRRPLSSTLMFYYLLLSDDWPRCYPLYNELICYPSVRNEGSTLKQFKQSTKWVLLNCSFFLAFISLRRNTLGSVWF